MDSWLLPYLFYQQYSSDMYAYLALKMLEEIDFDEESSSEDEFFDYVVASKRRRTDSEHSEDRRQMIKELQDYGVTTSSAPSSALSFPRTTATGKTDKNESKNGDASRLNYDQQEYIVKYLEKNPDLAKGRPRTRVGLQTTKDEWTELAAELNKIEGGVVKTGKGWAKYWSNKKCTLIKHRDKLVASHRACTDTDSSPSFDIRLLAVLGCLDGNDQVPELKDMGPQEEGGIKLLSLQLPQPPEPSVLAAGPSSAPPPPVACDDILAETPPNPSPALQVKPPPQNEANIADQKDIKPKEPEQSALYSSFEKIEKLANKMKTHFDSAIKAWNNDRRRMKKLLNEQQKKIMKIRESLNNGRI